MNRERTWIDPPYTSLGDQLCALCATREYAKAHPEKEVLFSLLPEVLDAYGDSLIIKGSSPSHRLELIGRHRGPDHQALSTSGVNYLGTFLAALGMSPGGGPKLPDLPPQGNLDPGKYIVLQPRSGFAQNPSDEFVRIVAEAAMEETGLDVVAIGDCPIGWKGTAWMDCSMLGSGALKMMSLIRHSMLVLTPRSASAHIAAGYEKPSLVWLPDDNENWHLSYPGWPCAKIPFSKGLGRAVSELMILLRQSC